MGGKQTKHNQLTELEEQRLHALTKLAHYFLENNTPYEEQVKLTNRTLEKHSDGKPVERKECNITDNVVISNGNNFNGYDWHIKVNDDLEKDLVFKCILYASYRRIDDRNTQVTTDCNRISSRRAHLKKGCCRVRPVEYGITLSESEENSKRTHDIFVVTSDGISQLYRYEGTDTSEVARYNRYLQQNNK